LGNRLINGIVTTIRILVRQHVVFVIAFDQLPTARFPFFFDELPTLQRLGAAIHNIACHDDLIGIPRFDVLRYGAQRGIVGVNVREDGELHLADGILQIADSVMLYAIRHLLFAILYFPKPFARSAAWLLLRH
jgi:hypothetical protein